MLKRLLLARAFKNSQKSTSKRQKCWSGQQMGARQRLLLAHYLLKDVKFEIKNCQQLSARCKYFSLYAGTSKWPLSHSIRIMAFGFAPWRNCSLTSVFAALQAFVVMGTNSKYREAGHFLPFTSLQR